MDLPANARAAAWIWFEPLHSTSGIIGLDFRTVPPVVRAGQTAKLLFRIFHPEPVSPIKKFEVVHERQYHLFVISQDMEYFQHIHPEEQPDGTWSIDVRLPKPGYYKVLSDFMPSGRRIAIHRAPLVTAGYAGDLANDSAPLCPTRWRRRPWTSLTGDVVI
jgi:hypothetical protein